MRIILPSLLGHALDYMAVVVSVQNVRALMSDPRFTDFLSRDKLTILRDYQFLLIYYVPARYPQNQCP